MSGSDRIENLNPTVFGTAERRSTRSSDYDDDVYDPVDSQEVFDLIRDIQDPEHPLTLEQLNVVSESLCCVDDASCVASVQFTPTIPHCSMAALIGLSIRLKLLRALPSRFKLASAPSNNIGREEATTLLEFRRDIASTYLKASKQTTVISSPSQNPVGLCSDGVGHLHTSLDGRRRCQLESCQLRTTKKCCKCNVTICLKCFVKYHSRI